MLFSKFFSVVLDCILLSKNKKKCEEISKKLKNMNLYFDIILSWEPEGMYFYKNVKYWINLIEKFISQINFYFRY